MDGDPATESMEIPLECHGSVDGSTKSERGTGEEHDEEHDEEEEEGHDEEEEEGEGQEEDGVDTMTEEKSQEEKEDDDDKIMDEADGYDEVNKTLT